MGHMFELFLIGLFSVGRWLILMSLITTVLD
jgi:hypothetical protein